MYSSEICVIATCTYRLGIETHTWWYTELINHVHTNYFQVNCNFNIVAMQNLFFILKFSTGAYHGFSKMSMYACSRWTLCFAGKDLSLTRWDTKYRCGKKAGHINLSNNQCCVQQDNRPQARAFWTLENDVQDFVQKANVRGQSLCGTQHRPSVIMIFVC